MRMSDDLIELGMKADRVRMALYPDNMVTYCCEESSFGNSEAVRVVFEPGMTGVDYLTRVARQRLEEPSRHIEVDWRGAGLKIAQLALRFGADDFGCVTGESTEKPARETTEEDIRRIIRDAGFVPKRRDATYRSLSLY